MLTSLTKGGGGVSQLLTITDKGGGGSRRPKYGWHNLWTVPYPPSANSITMHIRLVCQDKKSMSLQTSLIALSGKAAVTFEPIVQCSKAVLHNLFMNICNIYYRLSLGHPPSLQGRGGGDTGVSIGLNKNHICSTIVSEDIVIWPSWGNFWYDEAVI